MNTFKPTRALAAALFGLAMVASANLAHADVKDYEFQPVEPTVRPGPNTLITVRLINKTTGRPVPDAVIFATRLDMTPDGMQEMATPVTLVPGGEPGTYRFRANFSMAGGWLLSLGAKVQGETGTVESQLIIRAQR